MRIGGESEKVDAFLRTSRDLPRRIGPEVKIVLVENPQEEIEVHIVVGRWARERDLRQAGRYARKWAHRVLLRQGFQGGWDVQAEFREGLFQRHQAGESYTALAKVTNRQLRTLIRQHSELAHYVEKRHIDEPDFQTVLGFLDEHPLGNPGALLQTFALLQSIGKKGKIAERIVRDGLEMLSTGQASLNLWEPVEPGWVREALRAWRNSHRRGDYLAGVEATRASDLRRVLERIGMRTDM